MDQPPVSGDQLLVAYGVELVDAVEASIAGWVRAAVEARMSGPLDDETERATATAATAAEDDVIGTLRRLLTLDISEQWTNPLAVIRTATAYPTAVLCSAGVPPIDRDADDERINPDDIYGLAPAAFADLGERVHDAGLRWGAAKAHVHLKRRKEQSS